MVQTMLNAIPTLRSAAIRARFFSADAAHRLVQQRVQGQIALLQPGQLPSKTRVLFVTKSDDSADLLQAALPFSVSKHALQDFRAKPQETLYLYPSDEDARFGNERVLLVGLGAAEKVNEEVLRNATHGALSTLKAKRARDVVLHVPQLKGSALKQERVVELVSQASILSNYQFDKYLSSGKDDNGEDKLKLPLEKIYLDASAEFQKNVTEQITVGEETIFARNLGNERSDVVDPAFMEEVARASADLPNMSFRVLQRDQLEAEGMEMFLSVGQAATCPPRLVILEYRGNPDSEERVALVGKGITFDTGGLNLKPSGFIEDMHTDMCGSAAVLGAVRAASRLGLKVNIVCALALAENAIGSKAVKPHTIVKSHKGITVENNNTDAEGRLVLGDTLSYIQQEYKPKKVIDVATLTGACIVALGEHCAGTFSNSDDLASRLQESGSICYERNWRLPILPEHSAELKGSQSDSRSTGKGRYGGACTAAAFLKQFIDKDVDWAHIDIAGPSHYSAPKSYFPKGATGFGVQLLYTYLKNHEQPHVSFDSNRALQSTTSSICEDSRGRMAVPWDRALPPRYNDARTHSAPAQRRSASPRGHHPSSLANPPAAPVRATHDRKSEQHSRTELMRTRVLALHEFQRERALKIKPPKQDGRPIPIPVPLAPGESETAYETRLQMWLRSRSTLLKDLRDDPLKERVYRNAYANTRAKLGFCLEESRADKQEREDSGTVSRKRRSPSSGSSADHFDHERPPQKVYVKEHSQPSKRDAHFEPARPVSSSRTSLRGDGGKRCTAKIPTSRASFAVLVAAYVSCYCPQCLRDWNLLLVKRLDALENELRELRKQRAAPCEEAKHGDDKATNIITCESPPRAETTAAGALQKSLSSSSADLPSSLTDLREDRRTESGSMNDEGVDAKPSSRNVPTSNTDENIAKMEEDSVRTQMIEEYNYLNSQILLNETVMADAVGQAQERMVTDMEGALREQDQIEQLRLSIHSEMDYRSAAMAMLIAHLWSAKQQELKDRVEQLGTLDVPHVERASHAKCESLALQLQEKQDVLTSLRKQHDQLVAAGGGGDTGNMDALTTMAELIKREEAALGKLERDRVDEFMTLFQFSYRVRTLCMTMLEKCDG